MGMQTTLFETKEVKQMTKDVKIVVKPVSHHIASKTVIEYHYSGCMSACSLALGLFVDDMLSGVAVFGHPVGRHAVGSISHYVSNGEVWELTRLVVLPHLGKNSESRFIARCIKYIKKFNPKIKCLLSYADEEQNHKGGIYQATNWIYQGLMPGDAHWHHLEGEKLHPRTVFAKYGTLKEAELKKIDPNYYRTPLGKKHRYVYPLKKGLKIMGSIKRYPKKSVNDE